MKKNEDGRSMVEMLGVLAIIGVLSVGGITGYSMVMNRYRAERIFNLASSLTASSTGGNVTGKGSIYGAVLTLKENGLVCISWNGLSKDVQKIFETRVAIYEKKDNCINFRKRKTGSTQK